MWDADSDNLHFMYVLGGALRPGYNHVVDSVSELLSPGAPNIMLITGIDIIYGALHILFGIGVIQYFQDSEMKSIIGNIGIWMIIGVGLAIIGTAIFPQDAVGALHTAQGKIHIILVFGVLLPFSLLSTLLIGIWFKKGGMFQGFTLYTFISFGLMVILGGVGAAMAGTKTMGYGERLSAIAIHQWLFIFSLKLLTS